MEFNVKKEVVLASESPRRKELLGELGIPFQAVKSHVVEENQTIQGNIVHYVMELAIQKAKAVAKAYPEKVVIGADTIVSFNGQILPKPENKEQAKTFLTALSGKTHIVMTAVAIVDGADVHSFVSETNVTFYTLSEKMIDAYVATEDPYDKAGAYGIQSGGLFFVKEIQGDYYSVMGLPVAHLSKVLLDTGIVSLAKEVSQ